MKRALPVIVFLALALITLTAAAAPHPPITPENVTQLVRQSETGTPSLRRVVFSPDGSLFATATGNDNDYGIKIWQRDDLSLKKEITNLTGIVWDIAFSPDGRFLVSAADDTNGRTLRVWNPADGAQVAVPIALPSSSSLAFSPDGSHLAVGGLTGWPNGTIWIYDTKTWDVEQQWKAANQNVTALVYTSDGRRLVSAGTDGLIRVWSVADGKEEKVFSAGKQANRLALSPDGQRLASSFCAAFDASGCTKGGVAVWNTQDWKKLQKFDDLAECLAFSPDGLLLVTGSGQHDPVMRFRRVQDWTLVHTLAGDTRSAALSPDGRLLVSLEWNKVLVWAVP